MGGSPNHPWAKCFLRQPIGQMVLNAKFWFLAIHRYQKQSPQMITFAARGRGMKLVIDTVKINENSKILSKTCVM